MARIRLLEHGVHMADVVVHSSHEDEEEQADGYDSDNGDGPETQTPAGSGFASSQPGRQGILVFLDRLLSRVAAFVRCSGRL